jgi:adenylate cyclase
VVLGPAGHPRALETQPASPTLASVATLGPDPRAFVAEMPGVVRNLPVLEAAASGLGMFTLLPEQDGIVRRVPAVVSANGQLLPALGIEILRVATGQETLLVKSDKAGVRSIVVAGVEIPTDREGAIWVRYAEGDPARYLSAGAVLRGELPAGALKGRLVLVGTSAAGLLDIKPTPLARSVPGVEIHAQLLETVLAGKHLRRPNYAAGAELALTALVGLVMLVLVPRLGALFAFLFGGGIAVALMAGSWLAFSEASTLLSVSYPLLASLAVYGVLVFHNYFHEERQRRFVRSAFGQYLAPALVDELARRPERLVLGGETREMTVLFADVRGFTGVAEGLKEDPQRLTRLVNRLLTPLSRDIVGNRGTIDKYMGDAVMAFWNAPLDDTRHAANACRAALAMLRSLERLNAEREAEAAVAGEAFLPLRIGIGINSGACLVGNLGSEIHFDYSVLGDTVNLASRLEGQTKTYGVPVLVGEATAAAAGRDFALLEVDLVRVVGKQAPERIFALLGGPELASEAVFLALRTRFAGFLEAYRAGAWDAALEQLFGLRSFIETLPVAGLLEAFERRILELRREPPLAAWDGVYVATAKA